VRAKGHKISHEGVPVLRVASNGINKGSGSAFERWDKEAAAEFGTARSSPISKAALLPPRSQPMW
jgi:hypothetical protein